MSAGDATERLAEMFDDYFMDETPESARNLASHILARLVPPGQVLDGDDGQVKEKKRVTSWLYKAAPDGSDWCWHSADDFCTERDHVTTPLYALRPLPDTREGDA